MFDDTPPVAGTVIRYNYLWRREADQGLDEAEKDRPTALILVRDPAKGECMVLPITHSPPYDPATAIEIPASERSRLGLDTERSWIVLTEVNAFVWPGPDLRMIPSHDPKTYIYGRLTRSFFQDILFRVQTLLRAGMLERLPRSPR